MLWQDAPFECTARGRYYSVQHCRVCARLSVNMSQPRGMGCVELVQKTYGSRCPRALGGKVSCLSFWFVLLNGL